MAVVQCPTIETDSHDLICALCCNTMMQVDPPPADGDSHHYFTVGRAQTHISNDTAHAQQVFEKQRALLCRGGIDGPLLAQLMASAANASFAPQEVEGLGHRAIEVGAVVSTAVQLMLNRAPLKQWLHDVTGCGPLSKIEGMVVQTRPGGLDHLDWHNDVMPDIRIGLTLHLVDCHYEGGGFELRRKKDKHELFRHERAMAGDICIFDIKGNLEHRVLPVSSGAARLVFTGWFMAEPGA
jgi:hypothetical protein